jgi:sulfatase modifying factor 1
MQPFGRSFPNMFKARRIRFRPAFLNHISMKRLLPLFFLVTMVITTSCTQKAPAGFVLVKGGAFINTSSKYYGKPGAIPDFYVGKYEVTQKEWVKVMGINPSKFKGENLPVETVTWYACVEYCNKRSTKEGLQPYYNINKSDSDTGKTVDHLEWVVTINPEANGYRLPTEAEWEYAASGGQLSQNYTYSGSNNIDDVAWYWKNSGDKYLTDTWSWPSLKANNNRTKPVGSKKPNELGLYDMSGNVREWCWDWHPGKGTEDVPGRIWKGGGWMGGEFCCESSYRASYEANGAGPDQGLRVWRNQ